MDKLRSSTARPTCIRNTGLAAQRKSCTPPAVAMPHSPSRQPLSVGQVLYDPDRRRRRGRPRAASDLSPRRRLRDDRAQNGEQAVELAITGAPDLILMDAMLPRMNLRSCAPHQATELGRLPSDHHGDGAARSIVEAARLPRRRRRLSQPPGRSHRARRARRRAARPARAPSVAHATQRSSPSCSASATDVLDGGARSEEPLAVILANLAYAIEELRQAGDVVDPDVPQSLIESQEAGRRLLRLLTNLADTARIEAIAWRRSRSRRRSDASSDRSRCSGACRDDARDPHRRSRAGRGQATIDVDLMTRAIENVVDNALRYTPSGSCIALIATRVGGSSSSASATTDRPSPSRRAPPSSKNMARPAAARAV